MMYLLLKYWLRVGRKKYRGWNDRRLRVWPLSFRRWEVAKGFLKESEVVRFAC